jgi:polysaccharide chain length determinant protein (PEP-CTERM system associated)
VIPGKSYKPEDFLQMAWRRKWIIAIPPIVFGIATTIWTQSLPNRYQSEATILVVPPRVSEKVVDQTMNTTLAERLQGLQQRLMSRSNLERIIQELNLYPEERKTMLMEQVVELMNNDAAMNITKAKGRKGEPNHFIVTFESENPRTAMQVADRLASLYLNANLEDREQHAISNTEFLKGQADDARKKLQEQEKRLEAYKRLYGGELPGQVQSNLQIMNSTTGELQQLADRAAKDRERQLVLEQLIRDEMATVIAPPTRESEKDGKTQPAGATAAEQLESARVAYRALRLKFKADHPDVVSAEKQIAALEKKAEAEALAQPVSGNGQATRTLTPAEASRQSRMTQMRAELQNIERRLVAHQAEEKRLQGVMTNYRARVERAPAREVELAELQRDHDSLQASYSSLAKRAGEAEVAVNLERLQVGEQFRIVDPARIPERPSGPDRMRYALMGLLAGLGLGVAVAGLLEYRDTSLRTEADVLVALSLPVVAMIPTMVTTMDRRKSGRRRLMLMSAGAVTVVVSVAAIAWKLRLFQAWIQ